LTELLKQPQYSPLSVGEQVLSIFAGVRGYLDTIEPKHVSKFEKEYLQALKVEHPKLITEVNKTGKLTEEQEKLLIEFMDTFARNFMA